jgi:hypothetical protein
MNGDVWAWQAMPENNGNQAGASSSSIQNLKFGEQGE